MMRLKPRYVIYVLYLHNTNEFIHIDDVNDDNDNCSTQRRDQGLETTSPKPV